ncbi:MAG: TIGR00645 family protein [Rickettsiaceae bacterium]|nr:TIGR00645 family protein [Rickettsiaceae bacterium]
MLKTIEKIIERSLFASRWLMAPFYICLSIGLFILLFSFMKEFAYFCSESLSMKPNRIILEILTLIDLSLAGNLVLIVVFSGYENFVSKMDLGDHIDEPDWRKSVDFAALKVKLLSSIIAIAGIYLLKIFMSVENYEFYEILWTVIIYLVFVLSGFCLALMDFISANTKLYKKK